MKPWSSGSEGADAVLLGSVLVLCSACPTEEPLTSSSLQSHASQIHRSRETEQGNREWRKQVEGTASLRTRK